MAMESKREKKSEDEESKEKERLFKKVAFFFAPSQVEPLREEQ